MTADQRAPASTRPAPSTSQEAARPGSGTFALFAEMVFIGAVVSLLSLPLVTMMPAAAAGVAHLQRHATMRGDRFSLLLGDFRTNLRGMRDAVPLTLALGGLALNVWLLAVIDLPGAAIVRWVSICLGAGLAVVALRASSIKAESRDAAWSRVIRSGADQAREDVRGSGLLVLALGICTVVVWMLPILVVVVPGMLVLATVAVQPRLTMSTPPT